MIKFLPRTCPGCLAARLRPKLARSSPGPARIFPPILPLLSHGLAAVARVAQALEIVPVGEQRPVSPVVPHMVHLRGQCADAPPGALPAELLPEQLAGPKIIRPDGQAIPAVPLGGLTPGGLLWLMRWAVTVPGELAATWVSARPEWLHCHGLSPPGKTKAPKPRHTLSCWSWLRRLSGLDVGSGSGRYSRWIPARSACSTPAVLWPSSPASAAEPCACRISGRAASHLSRLVYHTFPWVAMLWPPFLKSRPFVIHACKLDKYKSYAVFPFRLLGEYLQGVRSSSGSVDTSIGTR